MEPAARRAPTHREGRAAVPGSFAALRLLVDSRKAVMSRRLAEAAAFLIAHPDEVAFASLATTAARAGVSASALVRLAQSIGYDGFSQMQAVFQRRLLAPDDLAPAIGHDDTLHRIVQAAVHAVNRLDERTNRTMIDRAATLLAPAHTIFLIGQNRAAAAALHLGHALTMSGIRNMPIQGGADTFDRTLAFASAGDAAICTDFYPPDPDAMAQVKGLLMERVPVVLLTDSRLHPLVEGDRVWFEVMDDVAFGVRGTASLMCLAIALVGTVQAQRRATACG